MCVYCGSRSGTEPAFLDAARRTGEAIARIGANLVFGGGDVGLMGAVADAALAGGRHVIGVTPESLLADEFPHRGVQDLRIVPDMAVRKRMLADEADVFLTLPGGIGTMEELFEVWSWAYLRLHTKPIGLLNVAGYYDHLVAFLDHSVEVGLTKAAARSLLLVDDDVDRLLDRLLTARV